MKKSVDYYPFGMGIKEREWSDSSFSYRFGFNGKEQDPEVAGSGNSYDYGFRIYNPRLGKFLSVDPLFRTYPFYTPYQFAGNMPIAAIDLDGLEQFIVIDLMSGTTVYESIIFKVDDKNIVDKNLLALHAKMTLAQAKDLGVYDSDKARAKWDTPERIQWLYNKRGSSTVSDLDAFTTVLHKRLRKRLDLKSFTKILDKKMEAHVELITFHEPDQGVAIEDYSTPIRKETFVEMLDYLLYNGGF